MSEHPMSSDDLAARRRNAVRTAVVLALVAVAVYVWGIVSRIQ